MNLKYIFLLITTLTIFVSCKNVIEQPKIEIQGIAKASFDHKLVTNNCVSCHAPKQKANVIHNGGYSCENCHTYPIWKTTHYDHKPMPKTCIECHLGKLPKPKDGYTHWLEMDCKPCHNTIDWKKIIYLHQSGEKKCIICHAKDNPYTFHGMKAECLYCHSAKDNNW